MNANGHASASAGKSTCAGLRFSGGPLLASALALASLGLAACSKKDGAATPAAAARKEERYPLTGQILRVDQERKVLVVQHEEIKGYMPAMAMEFNVSAGDLALAKPGQNIRAELVATEGDFRLEKIWPNDRAQVAAIEAGQQRLREDTHNRGRNAYSGDPRDTAANFVLYNQNGEIVPSTGFRGKQIVLNFIFTRCLVPHMCPAATAKMMTLQRMAQAAGVRDVEFVSITLDPEHDTPGVLREYADVRGIDTANFSFLTGPEKAIKDLLAQFGVLAEFKGDMLQHTLATVLIGPDGKIVHRTDISGWDPAEFLAKMKRS